MNSDWMDEKYGIPHKNGKIRWFMIGRGEFMYKHLGLYDMTDWNKGWEKLWADASHVATVRGERVNDFEVMRQDQLEDLSNNVQAALFEAMEEATSEVKE